MNNMLSCCGLIDAKIRASDKDLPVCTKLSSDINAQGKYELLCEVQFFMVFSGTLNHQKISMLYTFI